MGWKSWEPHAQRLSATRRVVRVQLISVQYGLEQRPLPEGYSVRMESSALANAIERLDLEFPVDIAAWSFGAATSLDYALDHPERVRTLTLIEPPALWVLGGETPEDGAFKKMVEMMDSIKGDINEGQLVTFLHSAGIVPDGVAPETLPQWPGWMQHRRSLLNTFAPFDHKDDPARLRRFDRPVLLVKGTGSAPWLHQVIDALAERLPNARVIELPRGHGPQLTSIDRFLEEMTRFQDEVRIKEMIYSHV